MAESPRNAQAFDIYYAMGNSRSYEKVAEQIGVSKTTIYTWAKVYNWKERLVERDKRNIEEAMKETDESVIESYKRHRAIIRRQIEKYLADVESGKIKVETIGDFAKLVDLDIKLCGLIGEASSGTEDSITKFEFLLSKN